MRSAPERAVHAASPARQLTTSFWDALAVLMLPSRVLDVEAA